jgi:hypothetical protein
MMDDSNVAWPTMEDSGVGTPTIKCWLERILHVLFLCISRVGIGQISGQMEPKEEVEEPPVQMN